MNVYVVTIKSRNEEVAVSSTRELLGFIGRYIDKNGLDGEELSIKTEVMTKKDFLELPVDETTQSQQPC